MLRWFRRDKDKEKQQPAAEPQTDVTPAPEAPVEEPAAAPPETPPAITEEPLPPPAEPLSEESDHSGGVMQIPPDEDLTPQDVEPEIAEEIIPETEDVTTSAAEILPEETIIEIEEAEAQEAPAPPAEEKKGFFARLRDRLSKTKTALVDKVRAVVRLYGKVDEELLEEIEAILIQSDVGMPTTMKIVDRIRTEGRKQGTLTADGVLELFKDSIETILHENARKLELTAHPTIMLMVGVNGTGKTTTIGKIARQYHDQGKRVMMVAADTFRAAAIQQLAIWAERTKATLIRPEEKSDPASVVFEALEAAKRDNPDLILIDTAGRLHTKINLMEELKKIVRVIQKHYVDAPHETILVLDATTGQNAVNQVKIFHDACNLTGLIMTKLDGTAKGGVLIACKDMYQLPILKIGIGESAEDLRDFDSHEFVEALFSNGNGNGEGQK